MRFESQAELEQCLEKWQKILRLQDWEIKAKLSLPRETPGDRGQIAVDLAHRSAKVLINSNPQLDEDLDVLDMEETLVHELVHIFTEAFWPEKDGEDSCKWTLAEQCVDAMAVALVKLERRRIAAP